MEGCGEGIESGPGTAVPGTCICCTSWTLRGARIACAERLCHGALPRAGGGVNKGTMLLLLPLTLLVLAGVQTGLEQL